MWKASGWSRGLEPSVDLSSRLPTAAAAGRGGQCARSSSVKAGAPYRSVEMIRLESGKAYGYFYRWGIAVVDRSY